MEFKVTRAHLRTACHDQKWDLLDRLLEIDPTRIDDNALFTDTWGEWWGMLLHAVTMGSPEGVALLLKHGANRELGSWGDCVPRFPLEMAEGHPEILALLTGEKPPVYVRRSEVVLPMGETDEDVALNEQGDVRDSTGLTFPSGAFKSRG